MDTNNTNPRMPSSQALIVFAFLAFLGPNGLYLYTLFTSPELNTSALGNPIALAFMIEAMMLLGLFLWFVYAQTQSIKQVVIYLGLSFLGSLAFSLPLFLYFQKRNRHLTNPSLDS